METLAQSVSTIAPASTPVVTIPLVCGLAGNGTWLAYVLSTIAILLVAWCIGRFARYSSSPGSLYSYAETVLPAWLSAMTGWSLLLAYIGTAASVIGGFYQYANLLLRYAAGQVASTALLALLVTGISVWIAWRDIQISARLMLWIEVISMCLILLVVAAVLLGHGAHWDRSQLRLEGMSGSGLRLGLVLAMFSFVGFESATTLGAEARNPFETIPRAVIQSSILGGAFFTLCAYTEVLGFSVVGQDLGRSDSPMHVLARIGHIPVLGVLIDLGVLVSLFAGTLGCITAAARVLLLMAHKRLFHPILSSTHARHQTPHLAVVVAGAASLAPVLILTLRGASGLDVYGWMGSLATYGFIVAYALVCAALPRYLRAHGAQGASARVMSVVACFAMLLALIGNLYPVPEGAYGKLPYVYLAYLASGLLWVTIGLRGVRWGGERPRQA